MTPFREEGTEQPSHTSFTSIVGHVGAIAGTTAIIVSSALLLTVDVNAAPLLGVCLAALLAATLSAVMVLVVLMRPPRATVANVAERFRTTYQRTPVMMHSIDSNGFIVDVNDHWLSTMGFCRDEVIGKRLVSFLTPESRERAQMLLPAFFEKGHAENIEYQFVGKKGEVFDVLLSSIVERDRDGGIRRTLAVCQNITEQKKAQQALRESEQRFRLLFDNANDAIFLMEDGRFVACNEKTLELFGCTRDQILGEVPARFSPPVQPDGQDSGEKASEKIRVALEGSRQSFEWRHIRSDGTFFDTEVGLSRLELQGKFFLQAIVHDITERKRTETALRESNEWVSAIIEASRDGIVVEESGHIIYANAAFASLFGYSRAEEVLFRPSSYLYAEEETRRIA
ncbi:MAG: PAS domain S-box protein, partial [Ignavibacteria bacterium]|nr:PAS domain S-box protein [Ignavibacteria bacterium]